MLDPEKCKYFDLAQLVRKRAKADGAIVIVIKGDDSRIAPDLPPKLMPCLPDILHNCAHQSAAFLHELVEKELRPALQKLLQERPELQEALQNEPTMQELLQELRRRRN